MLFINTLIFVLNLFFVPAPPAHTSGSAGPVFLSDEAGRWADSVMYKMSLRQKIGQLFMVAAYPEQGLRHEKELEVLIRDYQIGGLIFFKASPSSHVRLQNHCQEIAQIPLLIGIDGEWGVSMRLDSTIRFPRQMTLGAIRDEQLIYEFGKEVGRECKRMGIHVNFAPVIDVNNNPANPVINTRSFGDHREDVARKGIRYMQGMQDVGIMACGKHFPGHGNTSVDSHYDLPQLSQSLAELDSIEMYPFRKLIDKGLASIMVAHLNIPSMDKTKKLPSTLSEKIVQGWLKDSLGFKGLVFTDALNMQGVTKYYKPGEVDLQAFKAGNDVLLFPLNVPEAVRRIEAAINDSVVALSFLNEKVRKILMAKYWACLPHQKFVSNNDLISNMNPAYAQLLNAQLYRSAITLLRNRDSILPLIYNPQHKIASVVVNDQVNNLFQKQLRAYDGVDVYSLSSNATPETIGYLVSRLSTYDRVIVSFHDVSTRASGDFGITDAMRNLAGELLLTKTKVIGVVFGNPFALDKIKLLKNFHGLFLAYEENKLTQHYVAEMIFGSDAPIGYLPVSIGAYNRGEGLTFQKRITGLNFIPATVPIVNSFPKVDSIIKAAIDSHAIPGCQLLVAINKNVVYQKTFGFHTYNSNDVVRDDDLYDIASITKIAATSLAVMKLYDEGKINIDEKASYYLPELRRTNKKDIVLREMWAHQSGLMAWIPFWKETVDENLIFKDEIYSKTDDGLNYYKVANDLYIRKTYNEQIWQEIIDSDNLKTKDYKYSDLGLIITRRIVERVTGEKIEEYLQRNFYDPLELKHILFRPTEKFELKRIVPTENDTLFRKQLVHGYVHDPGAAMTNGVDGHAGLFSTSTDLAVIMQLLLQGGSYKGRKYFEPSTVSLFTTSQFPQNKNRRALIFDKPQPDTSEVGPTTYDAPLTSFGHSGFTGAYTWADPENGLVIVFLTNRIYPDASNNMLISKNIRTKIQQAIYDDLGRGRFKQEQKHF